MFAEPMPLDRKILDVSQGMARTFSKRIYDESAKAITGFSGVETLAAKVGAGYNSELLTISGLAAQWSQASQGSYQIQVPALTIDQGIYTLQVILTPNGEPCYPSPREIFRGYLRVKPSPVTASGTAAKLYCEYADILELAPWLETTHTDNDMSGFFRQRLKARQWIDSAILRCSTSNVHRHAIFWGVIAPYNNANNYIYQLIQNDWLVISNEIREAAAHYSIFKIADSLSSVSTTGSYKDLAAKHYSQANSILQSLVAGFVENATDTNPTYFVDLRVADGRVTF